ncbi:MAG: efflux RND transporter periplasmic adaptor subunit [Myxococcota bacterium]|nr:efflux RND transporter periplasmic adaptor subunit [Myxococcota bacterium]
MRARAALLPTGVLLVGIAISVFLLRGQPAAQLLRPEAEPPLVPVLFARAETVQLRVRSQGTVEPRTESALVAEVPGQLIEIAPGFEPGAFFRAGDVLARLDPGDLELAVESARAALLQARAEEEYARARDARQRTLLANGIASPAIVDETRRAARIAEAQRRAAEVALARAERDLTRTRIVAPFDGRTRARSVDVGGSVSVGSRLGTVYAVDYAEVRLPVPDAELAYLDLPLGAEADPEAAPGVLLAARFAGREHHWSGHVVRTDAEIDPRTRMVQVIVRVPRPYETGGRPPLAPGLFVEAEILGRSVDGVVRLPRSALDGESHVWAVDDDGRLRRRGVEVLRLERDSALVVGGLVPGKPISLLEPRLAREGLEVRVLPTEVVADGAPASEPAS